MPSVIEIARVDHSQVGEVDHRIAVGVTPAEVVRAHLHVAEEHRRLVVEGDSRRARLLVPQKVLADIPVRDDLRGVDEDRVAASVITVVMRVQQVPDRAGR